MSTTKCSVCQIENESGGKFCKKCGNPIVEVPNQTAQIASTQATTVQKEGTEAVTQSMVEDEYKNLENIKRIYKILTAAVAIAWLLLVIRTYTYTENIGWAIVAAMILSPVVFTVGAQAEKIDISISQEKSARECVYYLKRISKQLERADRH